VYKEM